MTPGWDVIKKKKIETKNENSVLLSGDDRLKRETEARAHKFLSEARMGMAGGGGDEQAQNMKEGLDVQNESKRCKFL